MFLHVDQLSVQYPGAARASVRHVSLALERGQIGALLGPSGCGKTSLLRAVAGLERPARGRVVPVIDLAVRFWRKRTEVLRRSCIVIVEVDLDGTRHDLGIVVDAVCEVVDIPAAEVEPAPTFGLKVRADFIHGMGKTENGFVVLLDVNHVLSIDELADLIGETSRRDTPQPA